MAIGDSVDLEHSLITVFNLHKMLIVSLHIHPQISCYMHPYMYYNRYKVPSKRILLVHNALSLSFPAL